MNNIYLILSQKEMLDSGISELFGIETKRIKEQVRHNKDRFPEDYMFELSHEEHQQLKAGISQTRRGEHSKIRFLYLQNWGFHAVKCFELR